MKVLLAEYATVHDPHLAPEGAAMLSVLTGSFTRCGYEVVSPRRGDFAAEIARLAPACGMGLVIAPDHLLAGFTEVLEEHTRNIGCSFMSVALCSNKVLTERVLRRHGITVPLLVTGGRRVIKPVRGCGALGVRLSDGPCGQDEFPQEFIDGEHYSVSLVARRVVGEACLCYSGKPPLLLAVNRQEIRIGPDGGFSYLGGETPVHPDREAEMVDAAVKAVGVLGCQGYCGIDLVVSDRVYVVDVNPRITTSLVGITGCMDEEIAGILVAASEGEGPDRVRLKGHVRYDTAGRVWPA